MDLQFQFFGLLTTYVYGRSPRLGLDTAFGLFVIGWSIFYQDLAQNQPGPVLFDHPVKMDRLFGFLKSNIFQIWSNCNYYLAGLVLATFDLRPLAKHEKLFKPILVVIFAITFTSGQFFIALHNVFRLIPNQYLPLFALIHKLIWTMAFVSAGLYFLAFKKSKQSEPSSSTSVVKKSTQVKPKTSFNFLAGMTRMVFAIYLVNYFVIRTHFFTSRTLLRRTIFEIAKQCMHSHVHTLIVAFVFHLMFVMPFENIRKRYFI